MACTAPLRSAWSHRDRKGRTHPCLRCDADVQRGRRLWEDTGQGHRAHGQAGRRGASGGPHAPQPSGQALAVPHPTGAMLAPGASRLACGHRASGNLGGLPTTPLGT